MKNISHTYIYCKTINYKYFSSVFVFSLFLLIFSFQQIKAFENPCFTNTDNTRIEGKVFEEWDYDGIMNSTDTIGVQGVQVLAYDKNNNLAQSEVTDVNGDYVFVGLDEDAYYRIEFVLPASISLWAKPTLSGEDNGSAIQFVQAGGCANLGLINPVEYCEDNPLLSTACYVNGDLTIDDQTFRPGYYDVLVSFDYDNEGKGGDTDYSMPNHIATGSEMGCIWGLAYDKENEELFAASFLKRHTGFPRPDSLGIIWKTTTPFDTPSTTPFVDLIALGEDLGQSLMPADRELAEWTGNTSQDSVVFHLVGKAGLGGMEISDDGNSLFVVNLYRNEVIEITIATGTINQVYAIPNIGCTDGETRPFALKYHKGKLYAGAICSAENGGTASNLEASVFELNGNTFTEIFNFGLDYARDYIASTVHAEWRPWVDSWSFTPIGATVLHPQPILSEIEFDLDGSMILGFMDRTSHQLGNNNIGIDGTGNWSATSGGDILRACKVNGNYVLEGNIDCPYNVSPLPISGTGGEFYHGENLLTGSHHETATGGLAFLPQSGEIATTVFSPFDFNTGGISFLDNKTGTDNKRYEVYGTSAPGSFGKAAGLGALVKMSREAAKLEIGNYVWDDINTNGIQDANEPGIDGVVIELIKGGISIATTTTTAKGIYNFSSKNAIDPNLIWTGAGVDTMLLPLTNYTIRINDAFGVSQQTSLKGRSLTTTNVNANANDNIDNDASLNGDDVEFTIQTGKAGEIIHHMDIGFIPTSIGDFVWLDTDGDGLQGLSENGAIGVTVNLYNSSDIRIATTTTDLDGYYVFSGFEPGDYTVEFIYTNDYLFSMKNKGIDSNIDSDVNIETGITDPISVSTGERVTDIDAGLVKIVVHGFAWYDSNEDGLRNTGDIMLEGVTVHLYNEADVLIGKQFTEADGSYDITAVFANQHYVLFDKSTVTNMNPNALISGTYYERNGSSDITDEKDSDMYATTYRTPGFELLVGDRKMNIDGGFASSSLPVELLYFQGFEKDCGTELQWVTLSEENNSHFVIEKSVDGVYFEELARIEGHGNSVDAQEYYFRDKRIEDAINFYRLKQVDFDGTHDYSETLTITLSKNSYCLNPLEKGQVFPNPTIGSFFFEIAVDEAKEGTQFIITNSLGEEMYNKELSLEAGLNRLEFDISNYSSGIYYMTIDSGQQNINTFKIIVMNED